MGHAEGTTKSEAAWAMVTEAVREAAWAAAMEAMTEAATEAA
jgi:hypothetical protein